MINGEFIRRKHKNIENTGKATYKMHKSTIYLWKGDKRIHRRKNNVYRSEDQNKQNTLIKINKIKRLHKGEERLISERT